MQDHFSDLDDSDFNAVATKGASEKITFPCELCGGSGEVSKTYGYSPMTRRTYKNKCGGCQGRGSFTTSPDFRANKRAGAKASKAKAIAKRRAAFDTAEPGLAIFLANSGGWSSFALSLAETLISKGELSPAQLTAARSMRTKCEANAAAREAKKAETQVSGIDLTPIREAFAVAAANGRKSPTYRAEGLLISRAPDHGQNAGALYVKDGATYSGKIVADVFQPTREAAADVPARLLIIAADPAAASIKYGRATGSCGVCGRELTRKDSIAAGIGPICASKWGF